MSANGMDFDMSPSRKSSVSQSFSDLALTHIATPVHAIIQLTLIALGALTGRTHGTGEIDERKETEIAKTNVGEVVREITETGTDEADLARGPIGTESERGTKNGIENAATAVVTGGREAKAATETATRESDAERGTKAKSLQN